MATKLKKSQLTNRPYNELTESTLLPTCPSLCGACGTCSGTTVQARPHHYTHACTHVISSTRIFTLTMLFTTAIPPSAQTSFSQLLACPSTLGQGLALFDIRTPSAHFPSIRSPLPFVDSPFTVRTRSQPFVPLSESSLPALCHS